MLQIHGQNIIACVWDFDKTLIPGYMQSPLFEHYSIDEQKFWKEVNELPDTPPPQRLSSGMHTTPSSTNVWMNGWKK